MHVAQPLAPPAAALLSLPQKRGEKIRKEAIFSQGVESGRKE
jgi:hypothetical protein